ncbi:hypothetical protein PPACK8108_LOCUS565 [Phakopsora pachyrhizi]|uniref:Uncharacterized protein n=1 Tax=Phakopsora pachyrhizi TaxID=170000 RepID=A0AAV0AGS0_PHAPC|nr:hypothetical protein PPACK8108_LOCUS565 [Phakopsora pachyrhizi]
MYSDNEQLYSLEGESEPPKKNFKSNSSIGNSSKAPLSGTSLQGQGLVNTPMQNNHTQEPNSSNRDFFVIPTSNSSHASVSDLDHHTNRPNLSSKNNYERCAHNLTKQSENLGNNTLELLLQTLKAQSEVQTGQESFFCNLSLLNTPAEKHAAIVYILANISQKMEVVIEAIFGNQNTANSDSQSNTSHTFLGSNNFVWTKPPKDYICIMLHQLFISPDDESYTKGTDSDSRVIGNSLFSLAMNNLQNRPKEWKNKYLPISFCKEENEAHSIILKNILLQDKNPEQPIPRLIELTKFLLEWAAPKGMSYSNKEVKDKFKNIKIQRRFALLRVYAAYQHFCNHEAPWPKIDEQLEILKKNSDYRNR